MSPENLAHPTRSLLIFPATAVNFFARLRPVDKKDQNCVEREDLCLALRYDPPFR
jgi:hypothetical protein